MAKTKALISFAVIAKLIFVFVFPYAKSRFSHNEAQMITIMLYIGLPKKTKKFDSNSRPLDSFKEVIRILLHF